MRYDSMTLMSIVKYCRLCTCELKSKNMLKLLKMNPNITTTVRYLSSVSASITKMHRQTYARTYPTIIVLPDGSSINSKYHEPRKIITLPLDVWTLSEAERKARIESRKPRKAIKIQEEIEDGFDSNKYLKYLKK